MNNVIIDKINAGIFTKIEFGCGNKKKSQDYIGIDSLSYECVDLCGDVLEVLRLISNDVIEEIYSHHFVEHVEDLEHLLRESFRVLKKGGLFVARVPHHSNPYFYSDYTHRRFFGLYTFQYLSSDRYFYRVVPCYRQINDMKIKNVKIIFGGERPFYLKYAIGKILTLIVNSNKFVQEFYETNLSALIPCTELHFELEKI